MIQVRRKTYRGTDGWLIVGRPDPRSHARVSIFTETETSARRIAAKVRAGQEIGLVDYEPACETCYGLGQVFHYKAGGPEHIACPRCGTW